jgi:N utilization substance protein B
LYFQLLLLAVELRNYAAERIDARRNKLRPTEEDLNPNTRFIDNALTKFLASNYEFKKHIAERKISWDNNRDALKDVFDELADTDLYKDYMRKPFVGTENDKEFWRQVFTTFIPESPTLDATLEEMCIYWGDDLDVTVSFIDKTLKRIRRATKDNPIDKKKPLFLPMFNNDDDFDFAKKLFRSTVENAHEYLAVIDESTKNWDIERIAYMDILIMQMALAEIMNFPTIPVNVTLNEYLNIAKMYSTDKSSTFINGILDKAVKQLQDENKLIKVVTFEKEENV